MLHDSIQRTEHPDIDHNQPTAINQFKSRNTTNKAMEIPIQTCHKKPPLLEKISQKSVRIGVCSLKKIDDSDTDSPQKELGSIKKDESIEKIDIDCTSLKNMKDESGHIKDGKASFKSVNASKFEVKDLKASQTMKSVKFIKFNEKKDVFTYKDEQHKENGHSRSLRKLTKSEKRIANKSSDQCCLIM